MVLILFSAQPALKLDDRLCKNKKNIKLLVFGPRPFVLRVVIVLQEALHISAVLAVMTFLVVMSDLIY
jgi:hypothetical protein